MSAYLVIDGVEVENCPFCGFPPRYRMEGQRHVIECCELRSRGKVLPNVVGQWQAKAQAQDRMKLAWDRALGVPTKAQRERRQAERLMGNGAVVEKRLNAFHDGRLMR